MNTEQIHGILSRIIAPPTRFLGVFAKDEIPNPGSLTHFPSCFVANTDPANKPGEHWVAYWFDSADSCEFFDSYGLSPKDYGLPISCTSFNTQLLQSLTSSVCGQFCIYYLFYRSRGLPLPQILNSFSLANLAWNSQQVARFVNKHFVSSNHRSHLTCIQSCRPRGSCCCLAVC